LDIRSATKDASENMLHNQRTSALLESSQQEQGAESGGPDLAKLALGFLRRQYWLIIIAAALGLTASVIFLTITRPTYTAHVKVLVGGSKAPSVQQKPTADETPVDTPVDLDTQIEILKSRAVAASVINQLHLADDPDFSSGGPRLRSALDAIRGLLGLASQGPEIDPTDEVFEEYYKRLSAFRVGTSSVVDVSFDSSNARRAAEIANAIATAYIGDLAKTKTDEQRTATAWLGDRLQELGHEALTAERQVNELKTKGNIVSADGKFIDEEQVARLNNRLVDARAHASDAMARLNRFESLLAKADSDSDTLRILDAIPDRTALGPALNAPEGQPLPSPDNTQILNTLRQQYVEYTRLEYEYSAKYGKDHMAVVNIRAAMQSIRRAMLAEVRRLAEVAKNDFEEAKQQQQEIEKQLAQAVSQSQKTSAAEVSIRELEISAKGYRSLYESFLQRYMSYLQQGSFPATEAQVVSPATPPQKKSKPKTPLILALGLFGGVGLGAALGLLREMKDRGFRTTAQIEDKLRLPCLSVVPLLIHRKVKKIAEKSAFRANQAGEESGQRKLSPRSGTCEMAMTMPSSRFAESIRSIRFAIDLDPTRTPSKVVGLTSALPDEGKSTIATSLAQVLANSGKRVIVVDCDLRNPSLSATLTPNADAGITDIVSGTRSLEDTVWTDAVTRLDFLPGKKVPIFNTSDILCKEQMKKLFDQLRATYDYVIVDLPPLAPVIDARVISALLDSFILVVEWGRTKTDVVEHALNTAPNVYDALLGVVLNKTDMKAMKRYTDHYGDYYNDKHYLNYGQLTAE
jgi:succinoglycan biosynthesis transport protein ExoP